MHRHKHTFQKGIYNISVKAALRWSRCSNTQSGPQLRST